MSLPTLREMLDGDRVHLLDGAMGTVLYDRGVFVNVCYDELSLSQPRLVESVHRDYVEAGAELIETNTFGANPVKLSAFGLEGRTREINRAAAEVARRAASDRARVLGAVGPLGIRMEPWGPTSAEEVRAFFREQCEGLADGGVDGFLFETFQDLNELKEAVAAAREVTASAGTPLPILAQVTIEEGGRTAYGADAETIASTLDEWGVDALGLNCSVGPAEILEAIERMAEVTDRPLLAQPNAGLPRTVGDRKMYLASPEYMAGYARRMVEAGVRFVGGCCGTTPEHIRRIGETVVEQRRPEGRGGARGADTVGASSGAPPPPDPTASPLTVDRRGLPATPISPSPDDPAALPLRERSPLGRKLAEGTFLTSLELVPPRGWDPTALLADAREARLAGVDVVSVPDAPRGVARMGSLPAATLLARETGLEVIAHYACRDRNMLGMLSDLLGAAASGVQNVLLVTGDLSPTGPYPDHTAVFDIDAIGLTNLVHHLNLGRDPGGQPLEPPTRFVIGVALNQGAADLEREDRRYRWKVEAGAEFALTQPVFDPAALLAALDRNLEHRIPVVAGLWPLASVRNAEFLANEVPGVHVPREVLERMRAAEEGGPDAAGEEGVQIALEAFEAVRPSVAGVHVSAPRGRIDLALRLVEGVRHALASSTGVAG